MKGHGEVIEVRGQAITCADSDDTRRVRSCRRFIFLTSFFHVVLDNPSICIDRDSSSLGITIYRRENGICGGVALTYVMSKPNQKNDGNLTFGFLCRSSTTMSGRLTVLHLGKEGQWVCEDKAMVVKRVRDKVGPFSGAFALNRFDNSRRRTAPSNGEAQDEGVARQIWCRWACSSMEARRFGPLQAGSERLVSENFHFL